MTITVPESKAQKVKDMLRLLLDEVYIVEHKDDNTKTPREKNISIVKEIAQELGVLKKTKEREVVTLRTTLVYYLRKQYSGPLIAHALRQDSSTIVACVKRYENFKHYADYKEATATVIQHLKRRSLVDFLR